MFLVVIAAVTGAALALILRGGRLALPATIRATPALGLGALGLAAAEWLPIPGRPGVYIVGSALLVVGLAQNIRFNGAVVTAIGIFLTGFVVLINGYLPVRTEAAEAVSIEPTGLRQFETDDTNLGILGDVVPLPIGPWVVSFGDLIAAAGVFILARSLIDESVETGLAADEFLAEFLSTDEIDLRTPTEAQPDLTLDLREQALPEEDDVWDTPPPPVEGDRYL